MASFASGLYMLFLLGLNWTKIATCMTIETCVLNLFRHASKLNIFVLKAPKQHVTLHTDLQKSQSLALKSHNLLPRV